MKRMEVHDGEQLTKEDNPRIKNFSDAVKQLESVWKIFEEKGHRCVYGC